MVIPTKQQIGDSLLHLLCPISEILQSWALDCSTQAIIFNFSSMYPAQLLGAKSEHPCLGGGHRQGTVRAAASYDVSHRPFGGD